MILDDSEDREVIQDMMGNFFVIFRKCRHIMPLNRIWMNAHHSSIHLQNALKALECNECRNEFDDMARKLDIEFQKTLRNGGLK